MVKPQDRVQPGLPAPPPPHTHTHTLIYTHIPAQSIEKVRSSSKKISRSGTCVVCLLNVYLCLGGWCREYPSMLLSRIWAYPENTHTHTHRYRDKGLHCFLTSSQQALMSPYVWKAQTENDEGT